MAVATDISTQIADLRRNMQTGQAIDAAQVKVIGLDAIREAAGGKWAGMAERVRQNSLNFIRGCIDDDDVVIPAGDGFLVIYSGKNGRDCEKETVALSAALNEFYLGEEGMQKLRASVERRSLDARAMQGLMQPNAPVQAPRAPPRETGFVPLWSTKFEATGAYFATPLHRDRGETRVGYETSYRATGQYGAVDFVDLDIALLEQAIAGAEEVAAHGLRCLVGFSIHASTMQRRAHWSAYQAKLTQVPQGLRALLTARIAEIEPGTPCVTMAEWVARLSTAASSVSLGLHHTDHAITHLQTTRAAAVALSVADHVAGPRLSQEQCRRLIDRWTPALHRQRIGFCLDEIETTQLLAYACAARVDAVTGVKFWPPVKEPSGVWTITQAELLGRAPAA